MMQRAIDRRLLLAVVVVLAIVVVPVVGWASNHAINIPALAFLPSNASVTYERSNAFDQGNLTAGTSGTFYAPVPFNRFGRNVCLFTLYTWDNDDLDVTARLMKKGTAAGSTFEPATEMAIVTSTGFDTSMRAFKTTTINSPAVSGGFFYFVELTLPNSTMQVLGVRIIHQKTC